MYFSDKLIRAFTLSKEIDRLLAKRRKIEETSPEIGNIYNVIERLDEQIQSKIQALDKLGNYCEIVS